jgi:hypothetical protein
MQPGTIKKTIGNLGRYHRRRSDPDEIDRAAMALVEAHGENAFQVSARRANNANPSGATEAAHRWKRIAAAILRATQG